MDNQLLEGFREWLIGRVTLETARDYVGVVSRDTWPPSRRSHIRAWRQYVKYLFSIGRISWEQLQHYSLFLKTPRPKREIEKAVDEATIKEYLRILMENELSYLGILLLGGSRLKHIITMLNTWNPEENVKHPTGSFEPRLYCTGIFCRYYLGVRAGAKRCDYIYYPAYPVERKMISYRKLRDKLRRLGVQVKQFRKYVNQELEELAMKHNIRLDAVNLVMSRELSITGAHYLNTRDLADQLFSIYVEYLKERELI